MAVVGLCAVALVAAVLTGYTHWTLPDRELKEWRFWTPEESVGLLRPYVWHRAEAGLSAAAAGTFAYLHDGRTT